MYFASVQLGVGVFVWIYNCEVLDPIKIGLSLLGNYITLIILEIMQMCWNEETHFYPIYLVILIIQVFVMLVIVIILQESKDRSYSKIDRSYFLSIFIGFEGEIEL